MLLKSCGIKAGTTELEAPHEVSGCPISNLRQTGAWRWRQIAIVIRGRDVLAFENYAAGCRQSRAFGDGLELRGANGPRTHGKRRTSLLPTKWEAPLHVGQVRRAVNLQ